MHVHVCPKSGWDGEVEEKELWHDQGLLGHAFSLYFCFSVPGEHICPLATTTAAKN